MSITFGKTRADNFGRIFERNPRLLTRNPLLNYLRFYKKQHPKYGLNRIMKQGSKAWRNLKTKDKEKYKQKQVMLNYDDDYVQPNFRRPSTSRSDLLPDGGILMDYTKRSLNAAKNIQRSWRNVKRIPRYGKRNGNRHSDLPILTSDQEIDADIVSDDEESLKDLYFLDRI